jgi:ATP phosphoribosyltransferase regulatory subunit
MILATLPEASQRRRLLVPDADVARAAALRREGWVTIAALSAVTDWHGEARRLGCSHVLERGVPAAVRSGVT